MDRWVVAYKSVNSGLDRNPNYTMPTLIHVETGYGNQRLGKQYVEYFITAQFKHSKTCRVSSSLWTAIQIRDKITTLNFGPLGSICRYEKDS